MNIEQSHEPVWVKMGVFNGRRPAQALQDHLKKEGFDSRLHDERALQRFWFLARQKAGVSVEVREEDWPDARKSLDRTEEGRRLLDLALRCPACLSLRVEYPQMTRKNMLPTLVGHVLVALRIMDHECYCEDCHNSWAPEHPAMDKAG
jgi:hypothetical protein